MRTAPSTPKKTTPRSARTSARIVSKSGGQPRTMLPEEWAFLQEQTTPTKSTRRPSSPLSVLKDDNWLVSHSPHQGRASMSFILEKSDSTVEDELFVKRVLLVSPDNHNDKAYREQRILEAMKELHERNLCFNFVSMVLHGKSSDNYVELVMQKSGETLHHRKKFTVSQVREVMFQILYALAVAQRELRFVHYDFHDKNILVESFDDMQAAKISVNDETYYVTQMLVKIADFALSRIELNGEEIYNTKNAGHGGFDPSHDLSNFASYLNRLEITDRTKNVDAMKQWKNLKCKMRSSLAGPEILLKHEFFDELKIKPDGVKFELEAHMDMKKKAEKNILQDLRLSPRTKSKLKF